MDRREVNKRILRLMQLGLIFTLTVTVACAGRDESTLATNDDNIDAQEDEAPWEEVTEGSCARPSGTPSHLTSLDESCGEYSGTEVLNSIREDYGTVLGTQGIYSSTQLSMRVRYKDGDILCYPPKSPPSGSLAPDVGSVLSVAVEIEFSSMDGAFTETFETFLTGGKTGAVFCHVFDPEKLAGAYTPSVTGYENVRVVIQGTFLEDMTFGSVMETGIPPGKVPQTVPIAYWDNR